MKMFVNFSVSSAEVLPKERMASPATKSKNGLYPAKGKFTRMVQEDYLKVVVFHQLLKFTLKYLLLFL